MGGDGNLSLPPHLVLFSWFVMGVAVKVSCFDRLAVFSVYQQRFEFYEE